MTGRWKGKKVLCIGDSITSDGRWQARFAEITGAEIETHAYGGLGIVEIINGKTATEGQAVCYDPVTGTGFEFGPLSRAEVEGAALIICLMAYNERHLEYGERGDMYPRENTLRGRYAYALERIYSLLDEAENPDCRIMLVCPHCVGKYDWINADGYEEFPPGSGRSLETMAAVICDIAAQLSLPCYDAWHNSGINRHTWKYFANSPVAERLDFDPNEKNVAPYPQLADQAHLNSLGYSRLGECIAAAAENI